MSNTIDFDFSLFCDKMFSQMQSSYSFCFVDNTFKSERAHPTFCRFNVFYDLIKFTLSHTNQQENQKIFTQQVFSLCELLNKEKEWAYPEKSLSDTRSFATLHSLETVLESYKIIKLSTKNFTDSFSIQITDFLENVSCNVYYSYAYPDNYYSEPKSHPSFQMLKAFCTSFSHFIDCIKTDDDDLKVIINNIKKDINKCSDFLDKAYPNNSFSNSLGHKSLEAFIGHWKKLKTDNIPLLNNYFNTKTILNDYQKTVSNKTIESIANVDVTEIEEPKPIIKKIKSML